jgi:hypothetical protein
MKLGDIGMNVVAIGLAVGMTGIVLGAGWSIVEVMLKHPPVGLLVEHPPVGLLFGFGVAIASIVFVCLPGMVFTTLVDVFERKK